MLLHYVATLCCYTMLLHYVAKRCYYTMLLNDVTTLCSVTLIPLPFCMSVTNASVYDVVSDIGTCIGIPEEQRLGCG